MSAGIGDVFALGDNPTTKSMVGASPFQGDGLMTGPLPRNALQRPAAEAHTARRRDQRNGHREIIDLKDAARSLVQIA